MSRVPDTIRPVRYAWTALCVVLCAACSETTRFNSGPDPADGGGLDAQVEDEAGFIDTGLAQNEAGQAECAPGRLCACSNGVDDNDDDDLADGFDSECTGPFDDDEGSFRVNSVNEGNPHCTDCFYDGDSRSKNDDCDISTQCTKDGTFANQGGCGRCDAQPSCVANCLGITPNGCDCFGCCEVNFEGGTEPIRLVATCDMKKIADPIACPRCWLNKSCFNPCETCELCPGRTRADLPLSCKNAVDCGERAPCMASADCLGPQYCGQGCCQPILF